MQLAVNVTGALYVGEQAVSDIIGGRVSDTEKYVRKALVGSVVGFLSGATGLAMQGAGLGKTLALGYGEGFQGSVATQGLLNEDGEINWAVAIGEGAFSAVMAGMTWNDAYLLDNTGRFKDEALEDNYQKYVKRNQKDRKPVRERLDWKKASDYYSTKSPIARGNAYNKKVQNTDLYPYHEVNLANGKRLDSYDPWAGEIISRKATDLDKITEKTFIEYVSEIPDKYAVGTVIRSNKYPTIDGLTLQGQYILEIPAGNQKLSNISYFEDIASEYGVILRYTEE